MSRENIIDSEKTQDGAFKARFCCSCDLFDRFPIDCGFGRCQTTMAIVSGLQRSDRCPFFLHRRPDER